MKKVLFVVTIALLISVIIFCYNKEKNTIFSNKIIEQKNIKKIIKGKKELKEYIEIYYNNTLIPYIKEKNYYFISKDTEFIKELLAIKKDIK